MGEFNYQLIHTFIFSQINVELVPFLQDPFATTFNKGVKLHGELCHGIAQVLESKVDAWQ